MESQYAMYRILADTVTAVVTGMVNNCSRRIYSMNCCEESTVLLIEVGSLGSFYGVHRHRGTQSVITPSGRVLA